MIIFFKPCFSCVYIKIQKQPQEVSCKKKVFLESSRNSQENSCPRASFLIKLHVACNFIKKEALAQVFSCEFCEIFKNTFFTEHLRTTTSKDCFGSRKIRM